MLHNVSVRMAVNYLVIRVTHVPAVKVLLLEVVSPITCCQEHSLGVQLISFQKGPHSQTQQLKKKKLFILYWRIADNNAVIVSGEQQRDSATYMHVSILPQLPPIQTAA